jgi:hypothetical protein
MRALRVPCLLAVLAGAAWADDPAAKPGDPAADATEEALEAAKKAKIKDLGRDIRKWAQGPWAVQRKDDILKALEALALLGGLDAADEALGAVPMADPEVRDRAFALVEKVHDKALIKPMVALLEHKDLRRDHDLHRRIAHALAVTADVKAIEPLTALISSEDAEVVAAAADALATFADAKVDEKREAVKRMIDLYESTWNMMNSVRPEDQKAAKIASQDWDVFGRPLRQTLQTLTRQQLSRPKDWRRWWNDHKKDAKWAPGGPPPEDGRPR